MNSFLDFNLCNKEPKYLYERSPDNYEYDIDLFID
jgi:hypothetical protein